MIDQPTVFIVDDDATARDSLAALVRSMGIPFQSFESAEEFLAAYSPKFSGCVVTDLRMSGMSGLGLQKKLTEMESPLPIVVITAYASIPVAVSALQNGAVTFLEKSCSEHELWRAIKEALQKNDVRLDKKEKWRMAQEALATLTDDERNVLELLAAGQGNKQIAFDLGVGLRTVENRRRRVKKKLGVDSFADLMRLLINAERAADSQ